MKFQVVNLGCKVNRVESDSFAAALLARGHVPTDAGDAALMVVNTCTVTGQAERKTRKATHQALRANPDALVVVTGCAAAIDAKTYTDMSDRVVVAPKGTLLQVLEGQSSIIEDVLAGDKDASAGEIVHLLDRMELHGFENTTHTHATALRIGESFRTRVGVKVQDGCDNACTYCIVHVARGPAWSRPVTSIVDEVLELAQAGAKEVVLTGINLGSYHASTGSASEVRLAGLLKILLEATDRSARGTQELIRFRVSSIEPRDVAPDFVQLLSSTQGRICRHLHLPLQSGSSKVLREMARPYSAERFCEIVDDLRVQVPSLSLTTDVIAGFPGESETEFLETCAVCTTCEFSKLHVFPYSLRKGTPAAQRSDQVPHALRFERAAHLRQLSDHLREQDYAARAGSEERVLVEGAGHATTESYYEIAVPESLESGSLVRLPLPKRFLS
ncbi:tRNA (N(6)-L-threonylcarbamoyladenosine(37)-C(2))-methylthiotransferase MtaB [Adlercreutzia sp. ZJ141]|uniref:tRNA (N(6)-L-threonylcarbamoyladenosine(37)-C(2))- methylthiotransferase MtaB n=1 Tax=Adlercreutzia sp. ZJ141 TaxID=2709406 RepID=UPI0013EC1AA8|nr:tRNA (N(6)-L-threonylcarbamoyladenosine(37)-C(2))-methylthiotransferase MtaB [Adlercreutzia sp. ZJ141]